MSARTLLFNPIRAQEGELEATMVARVSLVDELEASVVADAAATTVRHWLVVAPRGSGKSHLTEVLARRMRRREGWSVVRLPEEAYRVSSVADLLAWIVGALDGVDRPFAMESDPARIEALAESRLRRWRAERGPVLVILENLGELLGRRFDRRGQARLRALLMGDPPFTLVATATSRFDEVRDHRAPFYDFFQERRLDELTAAEVAELVERRAHYDDATELLEHLDEVRPRLAALYHLSGGNPRLVLALYGVLRQGLTRELYQQLLLLLDDVTPYYQARLHDASPQGSRVLAEMAMAEGPLIASDIGRRCGLKTNQVTAVLAQLEEGRFVRPGGRPVDKRARYWEVTDRLFRIWLQMREQGDARGTVRWVVEFYQRWYEGKTSALTKDALRFVGEAWTEGVEGFDDLDRTIRHMGAAATEGGRIFLGLQVLARHTRVASAASEHDLRAAYVAGSQERRAALVVPLFGCALARRDWPEGLRLLEEARQTGQPGSLVFWADLQARIGNGADALDRLDREAQGGLEERIARILLLAHLGRGEAALELALRAVEDDLATSLLVVSYAARSLVDAGRADLALSLAALATKSGYDLYDDLGPENAFARLAAGEHLKGAELLSLRDWVGARWARIGLSFGAAVGGWLSRANSDVEAARIELAIPSNEIFLQAMVRAQRHIISRQRGWRFDAEQPIALDARAVLAEWSRSTLTNAAALDNPGPVGPALLSTYTSLRDLNLLPAHLPPWSDAATASGAADSDAALSALHPEIREAVLLLLGDGPTPG